MYSVFYAEGGRLRGYFFFVGLRVRLVRSFFFCGDGFGVVLFFLERYLVV